jgi:PAS domain S-box-containing protein
MSAAGRKARILVVDDKPANQLAMAAVLEDDYELCFANSGPDALRLVQARADLDVILMDVHMPDMDGFETASRIKRMPERAEIPIIFVTAVYSDDPFVKRGYEVGGIDYFSKPFDPQILKMKVAAYASFRLRADLLRERELHLRESEELIRVGRKLSSMLESLSVGVLIADVDGRMCQITEEAARILKAGDALDAEAYGQMLRWWEADGHLFRQAGGPLSRALGSGHVTHSEPLEIRCFDGTAKPIIASAAPLRALDGQIVGAVLLLRDITESRRIEEDLAQRVTKLVALGVELEETAAR